MKSLLLETIRCEDGHLPHLRWHQERAARSCRALFGKQCKVNLSAIQAPPEAASGLFKCRVLYDIHIRQVAFTPYTIRPVKTLALVLANGLDYSYKFSNRDMLQALYEQRGAADDILMVKNGLITDTLYANVAVFDGSAWYTPAKPLLAGTRRAALLASGRLLPADIPPQQLTGFQEVRLINAMMGLEEGPRLLPKDIVQIT